MPQIDHVPWLHGQGDISLAEWLVHITITWESGVLKPARALFTLLYNLDSFGIANTRDCFKT